MSVSSRTRAAVPYAALALLALSVPSLVAKDDGYLNTSYTKSLPSCNRCHKNATTNAAVTLTLKGPQSITVGKIGAYTLSVSSKITSTRGGFTISNTGGLFLAGRNTRTSSRGGMITHSNAFQRNWSFSYWDRTKTGLRSFYAVGLTADGNKKNSNDAIGFWGPTSTKPGTPFRVFINDSQVTAFGTPCTGTAGFAPILGAATNASRGASFKVELHNAPPATAALGILGFSNKKFGAFPLPLPLAALGAPGCELNVSLDLVTAMPTAGTGAGNGTASWNYPIPNDASLKGMNA